MAVPPPPPAPPPPVETTAGQAQKAAAVVTPKGQGEDRGALWDEIRKGKQLKKHPQQPIQHLHRLRHQVLIMTKQQ